MGVQQLSVRSARTKLHAHTALGESWNHDAASTIHGTLSKETVLSLDGRRRQARVPPPRRVVRVGAELCGQWCPDSAGLGHAIATGVAWIPAFRIGFVPTLFA